jgi:imidazoleglycerol phosphate dehydratase HisB
MLTRQEILGADDLQLDEHAVPEWGGTVYLRALTSAEREQLEGRVRQGTVVEGLREQLVAAAVVDVSGRALFTPADVPALAEKNGAVMDRLATAILRLSGMGAQAVEEAEKNSAAAPSGDLGSASP